jgi:hypothetical protein
MWVYKILERAIAEGLALVGVDWEYIRLRTTMFILVLGLYLAREQHI